MPSETAQRYTDCDTLYNSLGLDYEKAFAHDPAQNRSIDWLLSQLSPGSTILDVGSGTGKPVASRLAAAGHHVTGIDVSPDMVKISQRQVPDATFHTADALTFDPPDNTRYDAVVTIFAFLNGHSRADFENVMGRMGSWVKPGRFFAYGTILADMDRTEMTWMGRKTPVTSWESKEKHLEMVNDMGMAILGTEEEKFQPDADTVEERHLFVWGRKNE